MKDECHQSLLFSTAVAFPRMRGMNRECRVRPVGPLVRNPVLGWVIARWRVTPPSDVQQPPLFLFCMKGFFFLD